MVLATAAFAIWPGHLSAQKKQIDIGAAEAPLSDGERVDLDKAVGKHNYAAEKAVIDRALTEHPMSREMEILAGRLAYLEKNPKDAVEAFERADKIKPLSEDDRMTLALADQFSGRPAQARAEMVTLTRASPERAYYFYLLGHIDALNSHLEDAMASFRTAIKLDPSLMRAYEDLGQAQETLGFTDDASKTYEAGAERNRLQKTPWEWSPLDLGVVLLKNGELDQAEKLFREALQYNRRFGLAHYYLGQLDEKKGLRPQSITEYQEAVVDTPTLRQAWLALGREYTRLGRKAEADRCLAMFKQLEDRQTARGEKK
jgi:tetratricopeptide (TPR) repeat protein